MSYVEKNLLPGESVIHRARLHWVRYGWAVFWLLLGCLSEGVRGPLIALGIVLGAMAFLDVMTSEFVVTNKRLYMKQGILRRRSTELFLSKLESLQIDQGILGRMLDFGSIVPSGSGGTRQGFVRVARPLAFRQRVNEQADALARKK